MRALGTREDLIEVCPISLSPYVGTGGFSFSRSEQDRHTEVLISELNDWAAFPLTDATPAASPSPAYGSSPERLATSSLWDSFIPNPKPVYPGAFSDPSRFLLDGLGKNPDKRLSVARRHMKNRIDRSRRQTTTRRLLQFGHAFGW